MKKEVELLELYKVSVEMVDRLSARRGSANTLFITLESALSAALGVWIGNGESVSLRKALALTSVSAMISLLWWTQISSYRNISTAKFEVIHEIERELSFAPFTREWKYIQKRRHIDLTKTEQFVPFIFLAIDVLLIWTAAK